MKTQTRRKFELVRKGKLDAGLNHVPVSLTKHEEKAN